VLLPPLSTATEFLCEYKRGVTSGNTTLAPDTKTHEAPSKSKLCGDAPTTACTQRQKLLKDLHSQADKQWDNVETDGQKRTNSVIFNVFIWCQVSCYLVLPTHRWPAGLQRLGCWTCG
jgi:hypothetical protein